ncbi:MAG: hypothetical protein ABI611_00965 [Solirubrobacteraceae bacterium]
MATVAVALLAALALPAAARAAASITIGHGFKPGVAVDAAGTAYVAWYEDDGGATTLRFCRLPRGAVACEAAHAITAPNSSLSRPFVTVSGSTVRIAQYRYPIAGPIEAGVWEFTSTDRGAGFDSGHRIGSIPFNEAVQGPGDTISAATNAQAGGLAFQNMPLGGASAGTDTAVLSLDHPYNGSVGLVDAGTPLTVFSAGDSQSQFRRYNGSDSVNDDTNWTPATSIGYADYPRLAGGPTGLFLLAGTPSGGLEVRRYDGATFAPAVALTSVGDASEDHITQDAAGRLHAVFPQGQADGLHLVHAVSDDGASWRSGTVEVRARGGIGNLRAAVAPDHVGVAAFESGEGTSEIHVVAIGPDAPVDPAPPAVVPITTTPPPVMTPAAKPKGRLPRKAGKAKRISRGRVRITLDGKLGRPAGISAAQGCHGSIVATVRRGARRIARESLRLSRSCRFHRVGVLSRKKVKQARKLRVTLRFTGNAALAAATRAYKVRLRR